MFYMARKSSKQHEVITHQHPGKQGLTEVGTLGFNSWLTCDFRLVTYPEPQCPYVSKLRIMKHLPCKFVVRVRYNIDIKCPAHSRYLIHDSHVDSWVTINRAMEFSSWKDL